MWMRRCLTLAWLCFASGLWGQLQGTVADEAGPLPGVIVRLGHYTATTASDGSFALPREAGGDSVCFHLTGYADTCVAMAHVPPGALRMRLRARSVDLSEAVITGVPAPVSLLRSPVRVEVITREFLRAFPSQNVTESLHFLNGVQETWNCGVCATNDIHINGMEGPYTLVLIDGMPVMSALASVYGLSGIPERIVDRIEIIRGPSATQYGSDAMGGIIHIRTIQPGRTPQLVISGNGSSHAQFNSDVAWSGSLKSGDGLLAAASVSRHPAGIDQNGDGFTDIPVITRYSGLFRWVRSGTTQISLAMRPYYEDRWGGELSWKPSERGGNRIYGESIRTRRLETTGRVSWSEATVLEVSAVHHDQDSYYGTTWYKALQQTFFAHLSRRMAYRRHVVRTGLNVRGHRYLDNSPADTDELRLVPGLYVQDEWEFGGGWTLLSGMRVDYHRLHGWVWAPQANLRYIPVEGSIIRLNVGRGFRLVNLFAEDHAALTGSREVVIREDLKPEESFTWSADAMHVRPLGARNVLRVSAAVFYTEFGNKIVPDYQTDPDLIIYENLTGRGLVKGASADVSFSAGSRFRASAGITWTEGYERESDGSRIYQLFTPNWSGNGQLSWRIHPVWEWTWTSKWMGPMALPVFPGEPERPSRSPWFAQHHAQVRYTGWKSWEVFLAVKNVWNYVQPSPLIRPDQPFSEEFDTSYVFGPMQGRHLVAGFTWTFAPSSSRRNARP